MKLTPSEALRITKDLRHANLPYNVNRSVRAEREAIIEKLEPLARVGGELSRKARENAKR